MVKTKHFSKRMSQRAIRESLVRLVMDFGNRTYDNKVRLDRSAISSALLNLDSLRKQLILAEKKGGVIVVEEDCHLITTYPLGR